MGLLSGSRKLFKRATNPSVLNTAGAVFANPLLAQDIMAGQLASGNSGKQAITAPGSAVEDPHSYFTNKENIEGLIKANAAIAGGAAGGAALAGATTTGGLGLAALNGGAGAVPGTLGAMGAGGGALGYGVGNALTQDPRNALKAAAVGGLTNQSIGTLAPTMMGTKPSASVNQIAPGSGDSDYLGGGAASNVEQRDLAKQEAYQTQQQNQQNKLLEDLYAKFGIGTSTDAQANARGIEGVKNNILNAYQNQQQQAADTSYLNNLTQARQSAAGSGALGGSQDQQTRNSLYQAYAGNRASALQGRTKADEALNTSLAQQKQALENQIRGRQRTDLTNVGTDISQLNSAASGAFANAAAGAIPLAANIGSGYSLANAYGNNNFNKAFKG